MCGRPVLVRPLHPGHGIILIRINDLPKAPVSTFFPSQLPSTNPLLLFQTLHQKRRLPLLCFSPSQYRHHAVFHQSRSRLGAAKRWPPRLLFFAIRQDHQQPAHQRRHQGHLPGIHWKAGNVSLRNFRFKKGILSRLTHDVVSTLSKLSNTVRSSPQRCHDRYHDTCDRGTFGAQADN